MKTSTAIGAVARHVGEEKAIELVARAGFDAFDLSMTSMFRYDKAACRLFDSDHPFRGKDYLAFARRLGRIGRDCGIVCNQSHAPFPVKRKEIREWLQHALECTAEVGGRICVVHPNNDLTAEENAEMYAELLPFAKRCGVKIATENMWNWDKEQDRAAFAACATTQSFIEHIRAVNDPYLVACVDIGHAEMMGECVSAAEMIRGLGSAVQALHIHDNDKWKDSHQLPYTMQIDFEAVLRALKDIDYQGDFTLEVGGEHINVGGGSEEALLARLSEMYAAVRRMADRFVSM